MNSRSRDRCLLLNSCYAPENKRRAVCNCCFLLVLLFVVGTACGTEPETSPNPDGGSNGGAQGTDSAVETNACVECCRDGFARETASSTTRLVRAFTPSPEGVTVCPNGEVFLSFGAIGAGESEIKRVPLDGSSPEHWSTIPGPTIAGITCDDKGRLFVAQFSGQPAPSTIIMVTAKDDPGTRLPTPSDGTSVQTLNGIVAIKGLGVYASDTTGNTVLHARETAQNGFEVTVAATDVFGANGLAFDSNAKKLYVGMSTTNKTGALDVAQDGTLGEVQEIWTGPDNPGFVDGTAVDEQGAVYVAYWLTGKVIRLSDDQVISNEVENPASLAFRGGTLLITDYKLEADVEGGLYALDLGVCGAPTE